MEGERCVLPATLLACWQQAAEESQGTTTETIVSRAGRSGGASGPCRPGLKTYRKFSPWFRTGVDEKQWQPMQTLQS